MANHRLTTTFTPEMKEALDEWGAFHGAKTESEALRLAVTFALAEPPNRALAMAYQQARADLATTVRKAFIGAMQALGDEMNRKSHR